MTYSDVQLEQLLKPIHPKRVGHKENQSHVEAYEITAHLTRLFGFPPNWRKEIIELECIEQHMDPEAKSRGKTRPGYWAVYRCRMRLWVLGEIVSDDVATGDASNQVSAGDAHDMAAKTAVSQALKRCAKDLGDQFGLSLYRQGSTAPLVGRSLAYPPRNRAGEPMRDRQQGDVESHAPAWEPEQDDRAADPETGEVPAWDDDPLRTGGRAAPGTEVDLRDGRVVSAGEWNAHLDGEAPDELPDPQADLGGQLPSASLPEQIAQVREQLNKHPRITMIHQGCIRDIHVAGKLLGHEGQAGHEMLRALGNVFLGTDVESMNEWTLEQGKAFVKELNLRIRESRRGDAS
jgi:hypothetical protein